MLLPPPDQLPETLTPEQEKAIILLGIVNPNYEDGADEVLSYSKPAPGHLIARVRDGKKIIDFEIKGDEVSYGLADDPANAEFAEATPDTFDNFLERLAEEARPSVEDFANTLRTLYEESGSEVEFSEKLQSAYPLLEGTELTQVMAQALKASRLSGIFDSEQDA